MGNKVAIEEKSNSYTKKEQSFFSIFNRIPKKKFILGIIDPQNDFCEGGTLAVQSANEIFAPINKLRYLCVQYRIKTFISQDYHPSNHMSFGSTHKKDLFTKINLNLIMDNKDSITCEQIMWPNHCVQGTSGANFFSDLIVFNKDVIFQKGTNSNVESYSAFGDQFNNFYENTGLNKWLTNRKITDIILVGLATDYCVYNTGLDAIKLGYSVHLILSCVRGVNPETTSNAIIDMKSKGIYIYKNLEEFVNNNLNIFTNVNMYL